VILNLFWETSRASPHTNQLFGLYNDGASAREVNQLSNCWAKKKKKIKTCGRFFAIRQFMVYDRINSLMLQWFKCSDAMAKIPRLNRIAATSGQRRRVTDEVAKNRLMTEIPGPCRP
jgi:hypothetical protein